MTNKKKLEMSREPAAGDAVHYRIPSTNPRDKREFSCAAEVKEVHDAATGECTLAVSSPHHEELQSVRARFGGDVGQWSYPPAEG